MIIYINLRLFLLKLEHFTKSLILKIKIEQTASFKSINPMLGDGNNSDSIPSGGRQKLSNTSKVKKMRYIIEIN